MFLEINPATIIDLFSFFAGISFGFLLLTSKSDNKKANIFLALTFFSLSFEVLDVLGQSIQHIHFRSLQTSSFTIPLLLIYTFHTINFRFNSYLYLIFVPGFIQNVFIDQIDFEEFRVLEYFFNLSILVIILRVLKSHRSKLEEFYSDLEFKSLYWISTIAYIFLGFHALWITEDIISFSSDEIVDYFAFASTIFTLFLILWMGHFGFSQNEIFKQKLFVYAIKKEVEPIPETLNYDKFEEIDSKIQQEKLFLNPKLNLRILSETLEIPEKELSSLINKEGNTNFYNFINQLRINEFKRLLQQPNAQQYSLLGLAKEAGFNSKSTFYAAFKTIEGMTPKQYESGLSKE